MSEHSKYKTANIDIMRIGMNSQVNLFMVSPAPILKVVSQDTGFAVLCPWRVSEAVGLVP